MAYVGPGDVVAGATGWWGLRAYTAAIAAAATQRLLRVRRDSDNATANILVATSGGLGVTADATAGSNGVSPATWAAGANLFCDTWYDQGSTGTNVTQATASKQPQLLLTGGGANSLPVLSFVAANSQFLSNAGSLGVTLFGANPGSVSAFFNSTSTSDGFIANSQVGNSQILRVNTSGSPTDGTTRWGSTLHFTITNSAFHAVNMSLNDTSGTVTVDTSDVGTGAVGPDSFDGVNIGIYSDTATAPFHGLLGELGSWNAVLFNATQRGNMYANQNDYWNVPVVSGGGGSGFVHYGPLLTTAAAGYGLELVRALGRNPKTTRRGMLLPRNWHR